MPTPEIKPVTVGETAPGGAASAVQASTRAGAPAHQALARTVAQTVAEVLGGRRPSIALAGWFELLPLNKVQRRCGWERELASAHGFSWPWAQASVLACHVQAQFSDHAPLPRLECCASIVTPRGVRAVAFSMQARGRRLRCTEILIG